MFDREFAQRIKEQYPVGTRIRLESMNDPQAVPSGTEGTVIGVDSIGQIMMKWDNGRSLSLVPGEDSFSISLGRYTTDAMGEIVLTNLEPGTYLIKEVATDDDHVVDSTPQEIELSAGDGIRELVFFNALKPGMHLVKVDSITMQPLSNVRFEFKLVGGSYRQEFTTDINGEIDLSKLEPGTYEVRELEAPSGYLILSIYPALFVEKTD